MSEKREIALITSPALALARKPWDTIPAMPAVTATAMVGSGTRTSFMDG